MTLTKDLKARTRPRYAPARRSAAPSSWEPRVRGTPAGREDSPCSLGTACGHLPGLFAGIGVFSLEAKCRSTCSHGSGMYTVVDTLLRYISPVSPSSETPLPLHPSDLSPGSINSSPP